MTPTRATEIREQLAAWSARPSFLPGDAPILLGIMDELIDAVVRLQDRVERLEARTSRMHTPSGWGV